MANSNGNNANEEDRFINEELTRIDQMIADMMAAERKAFKQGLKPWEYNLSAMAQEESFLREEEKEKRQVQAARAENVPVREGQAKEYTGSGLPEAQKPLPKVTGGMEGQEEAKADWESVPEFYKSVADIDYWKTLPSGMKQHTTAVIVPRQINGQDAWILKEDDWVKEQPWAQKTTDTNGDTVYYTTDPEVNERAPNAIKPDLVNIYPENPAANTFSYSSEFGLTRKPREGMVQTMTSL